MNDVASPSPTPKPAVLDKRERMRFLAAVRRMWRTTIVDSVDQVAVLEKLDDEAGLSGRYIFMILMSAAIAVLGLLLSSPAVVIGAMLLSPLMGPIIGAGFALVVGDALELRTTARTLLYGTVLAIGISALIVFLSPIQTVTPEIAARTRPNLFDLGVALFSALAGAYAFIRGRDGTIVGVAIATALMPPLSVIGFGLATFNWTVFGGALLLFITNLMTIALSAAVMARYYGFSTALTKKQTRLQVLGILTAFALLAIPLSIALRQIAWETNAQRQAQSVIRSLFPEKARISQIELSDHDGNPRIVASVLTPQFVADADRTASKSLRDALGRDIEVSIDQYRVGTEPGAAEAAELAAAGARKQAEELQRQLASLTNNLALVSGTGPDDIVIDRDRKRAIAVARPLPGASLEAYRQLEQRVAADAPGWTVALRPPAVALPDITVDGDGAPDADALALVAWAIPRVGAPVELRGGSDAVDAVATALEERKVTNIVRAGGSGSTVSLEWTAPSRTAPR